MGFAHSAAALLRTRAARSASLAFSLSLSLSLSLCPCLCALSLGLSVSSVSSVCLCPLSVSRSKDLFYRTHPEPISYYVVFPRPGCYFWRKCRFSSEPAAPRRQANLPPRSIAVARARRTITVIVRLWLGKRSVTRVVRQGVCPNPAVPPPQGNDGLRQAGEQHTNRTKQGLVSQKISPSVSGKQGFADNSFTQNTYCKRGRAEGRSQGKS